MILVLLLANAALVAIQVINLCCVLNSYILITLCARSLQATILGSEFNAFSTEIGIAEADGAIVAALFPIVERVRICMLQASGAISPENSISMAFDRNQLPALVETYR